MVSEVRREVADELGGGFSLGLGDGRNVSQTCRGTEEVVLMASGCKVAAMCMLPPGGQRADLAPRAPAHRSHASSSKSTAAGRRRFPSPTQAQRGEMNARLPRRRGRRRSGNRARVGGHQQQ
jgi:hypothetical protein